MGLRLTGLDTLSFSRLVATVTYRRQVEEVINCAAKHAPAVLQNESHPYLHEKDLRDYCRLNKIVFQVQTRIYKRVDMASVDFLGNFESKTS